MRCASTLGGSEPSVRSGLVVQSVYPLMSGSAYLGAIACLTALLAMAVLALLATRLQLRQARRVMSAPHGEFRLRRVSRSRLVAGAAVKGVVTTATRVRDGGISGLLVSSIDDITRWANEYRTAIVRVAAPDGNVTILFSDIESSTIHNERLGDDEWVDLLEAHNRIVQDNVRRHHGQVVKTQGDGFMVVFRHPAEGVRAAIDIQRALDQAAVGHLRRVPIRDRIGVHVGSVVARGGDYFGRNVAMAARVAGHAAGGQILVSDEVRRSVGTSDVVEFDLVQATRTHLKGMSGVHQLWCVRWE